MSHFFYQLYLMSEHTPKTNTFSLICSVFRTQALLPVSFSRQEYWSGLPFPSPMHESEKWKWSLSVMSDPQRPHGLQLSRLLRPWDLPGKTTGVGFHCLLCRFPVTSYKIQWWFTGIGCVIWLFSVARCTVRASWELLSLRSWRLH